MREKVRFIRCFLSKKAFFTLAAMLFSLTVFAQQITVSGTVTDSKNEVLPGATVMVKGTNSGTATDIDGNFVLNVDKGATLTVSYTGYRTSEVKARESLKIVLQENDQVLNEVLVVGYGSVKRKDVTTAVSSVSTDDIDRRPLVNLGSAIQGRAAGVSVMQPNGQPGADLNIRVRGTSSFNLSNDPLYVVDGVPVDNIKFLSPNDVADIQILKDASSAAIYGSRAANGVVLITTKTGTKGDAKITFNGQFTLNQVAKKIDVLNADQYWDLMDEVGVGVEKPKTGYVDYNTDWFDETYQLGKSQNYQLSISDGTDRVKYYVSAGYQDDKGILNTSYFKRYNFRANVDSKVRSWLDVSANVSYADYSQNGAGEMGTGANRGGTVLSVINTPTYAPIWDPDKPNQYYNNFYGINNLTSPLENLARGKNNKSKEGRLLASGSLLFTFIPELTLKSTFTIDRRNSLNTGFLDPETTSYGRNQYGEGRDERAMNTVLTFDNVLTYKKTFKQAHNFEAMAGTSWTKSDYRRSHIEASHFRNGDIQTLNAANKISWTGTWTDASQWGLMSYFARVSYNWKSRYLITGNVRVDGSSRLHPDLRWGVFPSFSGAWRISSEEFMEGASSWLDDLKVRVGWGQTGNQSGLNDYAYLMRYNINRVEWWKEGQENAVPSITPANNRTNDLTWETTTQTNVGVDFSAFRNRLVINLDWYYKKTKDLLMTVNLPAGASFATTMQRNAGEISNKGVELNIQSLNFTGGEFEWSTNFNISANKNKLEKLSLVEKYPSTPVGDYITGNVVLNEPGHPLGSFYGYISDGVDPETGELMYRDLNHDGRVSSSDRTFIGDPNPKFTFGLTNTFSWKGFTLDILLQGSYGNDIYNASRIETEGMYSGRNQSARVLDRWRIPGQITDVPKAGFDAQHSTYFVEDGSYLRLKNVSLSYDIRAPFLDKWGVSKLQPYVSFQNLATWTSYMGQDPEVNQYGGDGYRQGIDWGTYPHCRSYVFGLNIEF